MKRLHAEASAKLERFHMLPPCAPGPAALLMRRSPLRYIIGGRALVAFLLLLVCAGASRAEDPCPFLTSDQGATDYWPSFSPDGRRVLFSRSFDHGKTWSLYVEPVSGGAAVPFAKTPLPVSATRATWSWKHDLVAFVGTSSDRRSSLWIIKGDGSDAHEAKVSGLSKEVSYPSWYPDASNLAVVDFGGGNGGILKSVDLEKGAAVALTERREVLCGMPNISPDGKRIAFAGQWNSGQRYDQSRNEILCLDDSRKITDLAGMQGRTPCWSPEGRRLVFESNSGDSSGSYAAFVLVYGEKKARQLTPFAWNANHPEWSPDGTQIVFSARKSSGVSSGIALIKLAP